MKTQQNTNNMKFFRELFSDDNHINEKSFVGFIAFMMMVVALLVDLVTGYLGKELLINQFIFDGFMVIVLGSFGIGSVDKFINAKREEKGAASTETKEEELG